MNRYIFRKSHLISNNEVWLPVCGNQMVWSPAQKMKFFLKDFFIKCDKIRRNLQIWSHLLKTSLIENLIREPLIQLINSTPLHREVFFCLFLEHWELKDKYYIVNRL